MSTRDVSASVFAGNAGAATLSFKVSMSGSSSLSAYDEIFDTWLNSYSPRSETILDFTASSAPQNFTPNSNTRFIIIIPPPGCTSTFYVGPAVSVDESTLNRANCPVMYGNEGTVVTALQPTTTFPGIWRVLQF